MLRAPPCATSRRRCATASDVAVIAEVKKASPSAGPIAPDCEASKQALHYQDGGAAAISVLTEPECFGGSFADLSDVADAVDIPVLCKDFVVDPVQLFVARGHGADAVLLMVSVLGDMTWPSTSTSRPRSGLTPLVEVVDMPRARTSRWRRGARLIARQQPRPAAPWRSTRAARRVVAEAGDTSEAIVVAASGVRDARGRRARRGGGADAVLVGEALMRRDFPEDVLRGVDGRAPGEPVTSR